MTPASATISSWTLLQLFLAAQLSPEFVLDKLGLDLAFATFHFLPLLSLADDLDFFDETDFFRSTGSSVTVTVTRPCFLDSGSVMGTLLLLFEVVARVVRSASEASHLFTRTSRSRERSKVAKAGLPETTGALACIVAERGKERGMVCMALDVGGG